MKYLLLVFVFCCTFIYSFAQTRNSHDDIYYNYGMYSDYEYYFSPIWASTSWIKTNHISTLDEIICPLKRGKFKHDSIQTRNSFAFDTSGRLTGMWVYDKNNKLKNHRTTTFENKKPVQKAYYNSKNKLIHLKTYKYDSLGNLIEYNSYVKNGKKLKFKRVSVFDSNRMTESFIFKKDGKTVKYRVEYNYFGNGSSCSVYFYNSRGKLLHAWTENCSLDSKKSTSHKDTAFYCNQTEYDKDSNKIYTYRTLDGKNHLTKSIYIYDKKNRPVSIRTYNKNGKLQYESRYLAGTSLENERWMYNDKGKMIFHIHSEYDSKMNLISWTNTGKKNKIRWKRLYSYNAEGLKISCTDISSKNKTDLKTYYLYTHFQ